MLMPPIEWVVDSLLTQYGFSVMYGDPASGKSFIALDMALAFHRTTVAGKQ